MSRKSDAAYHPGKGPPPVVAVHLAILYQPMCHSCGWDPGPMESEREAELAADGHRTCT